MSPSVEPMEQAMKTWGATPLECPECHQSTPVYPTSIEGGSTSVGCLHCQASLQYKDGKAVVTTHSTASKEAIRQAEETELNQIALISRNVFGIEERELSSTLQDRIPGAKCNLLQTIKRVFTRRA